VEFWVGCCRAPPCRRRGTLRPAPATTAGQSPFCRQSGRGRPTQLQWQKPDCIRDIVLRRPSSKWTAAQHPNEFKGRAIVLQRILLLFTQQCHTDASPIPSKKWILSGVKRPFFRHFNCSRPTMSRFARWESALPIHNRRHCSGCGSLSVDPFPWSTPERCVALLVQKLPPGVKKR